MELIFIIIILKHYHKNNKQMFQINTHTIRLYVHLFKLVNLLKYNRTFLQVMLCSVESGKRFFRWVGAFQRFAVKRAAGIFESRCEAD